MNTPTAPTAPTPPIDLSESAAGEEDPGAAIDMPASAGAGVGICPQCGGTGKLAGRDCPGCLGTGKVTLAGGA